MLKTFLLGAVGYPILEILYRGRSHYSMAVAGGTSLCLIRMISKTALKMPVKALLCGFGITCVEFACGQIWNRSHAVWDYRQLPFNFHGQICLPYSLLWCGLSAVALPLFRRM